MNIRTHIHVYMYIPFDIVEGHEKKFRFKRMIDNKGDLKNLIYRNPLSQRISDTEYLLQKNYN